MTGNVDMKVVDQKIVYEQRCNDFRSLNGFLWQSPLIMMTLTGGLWFAAASFDMSNSGRSMLLAFAGLANLLMIGALIRLRYVMQSVLKGIRAYDGQPAVGGNYVIVCIFSALLLLTATGSLIASYGPQAFFTKGQVASASGTAP